MSFLINFKVSKLSGEKKNAIVEMWIEVQLVCVCVCVLKCIIKYQSQSDALAFHL